MTSVVWGILCLTMMMGLIVGFTTKLVFRFRRLWHAYVTFLGLLAGTIMLVMWLAIVHGLEESIGALIAVLIVLVVIIPILYDTAREYRDQKKRELGMELQAPDRAPDPRRQPRSRPRVHRLMWALVVFGILGWRLRTAAKSTPRAP